MNKEIKKELEERIDYLKNKVDDDAVDFASDYDLQDINYFCDTISSYADGKVDTYYYDLKESLGNGEIVDCMEEAVSQGLIDTKNYDFFKHIQMAQFIYYVNKVYNDLDELSHILAYKYLIDIDANITMEQLDEIDELDFDNNDNLKDEIDNIVDREEEEEE